VRDVVGRAERGGGTCCFLREDVNASDRDGALMSEILKSFAQERRITRSKGGFLKLFERRLNAGLRTSRGGEDVYCPLVD